MKYVAAYLLSDLAGTQNPTAADLGKILKSVGIEVDSARAQKLISELSGKNLQDVIAKGSSKLASVPTGGSVASAAAPAGAPAGGAAGAKKEEAKPAKKEEKAEEEEDMGFGIFD